MTEKKKKVGFIKKFNKQKIGYRISYILVGLLYLLSLIFFTKSLVSLTGIETTIRVIVLTILYLHLFIFAFVGIILLFTNRKKRFIFLMIYTSIFIPVFVFASFYIDKTYNIIDNVQKKYINYTSVMVSMAGTTEYNKIGMISAENDPTGSVIPKEMIKKENITGEIVKYDDYISMMTELYDGNIDAMFVADSYQTMFNSYEKFAKIDEETKVVYTMSKKLENVDNISYSTKDLTEPFTVLLMGVDGTGDGIASTGSFNGDTLMLVTFNPKTLNATVFSIPRDTFVPIACNGNRENKINSSAYGGTSCVVNTIENLTGIKIDYYAKINFTGVVKIVDDLGGVDVDVPIDFCEQDSQRRFGEHLICIKKGQQKLNGEQALAFARHRKTLPLGDFQRVQHQQMVVEAMVKELKNIKSLDEFYKILDDVANNVDTNMSTPQILSLYQVGKNILLNKIGGNTSLSIEKTFLTGYDLTIYMPSTRSYTYTFQYYRQSLEEIVTAMKVNLELEEPEAIKTFSFSAKKLFEVKTIGKTYYQETRRELVPNFVGKSQSYVEEWATSHEIELTINEVTEGDENIKNGEVALQQEKPGTLVDTLSSITVSIMKKQNTVEPPISEEEPDDTLPDFIGMSLTDFNKWKNSLKGYNLIIDTKELTADDILDLNIEDIKPDRIYKQSEKEGTKIEDISSLTVYYYKEIKND